MADKINKGVKSPSFSKADYEKNLGGLPETKTITQIQKDCKPPAKSPSTIGGGKSVRV